MDIMKIFNDLFPLNRSVSGEGLRESLRIINRYVPLDITEYASGLTYFGWEMPLEWNISEAYVSDPNGRKLIDFSRNNLHILVYSMPFEGWVTKDELLEHIYSLPEMPEAIPYITSVYGRRWGFCIEHENLKDFVYDKYFVKIDSSLKPGAITVGESLIKGRSEKEVVFFTHTAHPSMANDQLSGILTLMLIYKQLSAQKKDLFYSYRFIFCPETIGTAAYLSENLERLKRNTIAGCTVTFTGDNSPLRYMRSLDGDTIGDRAAEITLGTSFVADYSPFGSDERHFNSPGIDLPFGAFMRAGPNGYAEYHTSLDNASLISEKSLREAADLIVSAVRNLEAERIVEPAHFGFQPKLDKLNLYPTLGKRYCQDIPAHKMLAIWMLSGKYNSFLKIAQNLGSDAAKLSEALDLAEKIGIVKTKRGNE